MEIDLELLFLEGSGGAEAPTDFIELKLLQKYRKTDKEKLSTSKEYQIKLLFTVNKVVGPLLSCCLAITVSINQMALSLFRLK